MKNANVTVRSMKGHGSEVRDWLRSNWSATQDVNADSGPSRSPNPAQADHPFRFKPITDLCGGRGRNESARCAHRGTAHNRLLHW